MTHSKIHQYGPLLGRILLGLLFFVTGFSIIFNFSATVGYYASLGIPLAAAAAIVVIIVKIAGSLMLASGIHAREAAWALIVFTLLTILLAHIGQGQLVMALKNLAIIGGLLLIVSHGVGAHSLQDKCPCPKCKARLASTTSAVGGACNCGICDACIAARNNTSSSE